MKILLNTFTALLITGLLAACSGIPVSQDYEAATDFSLYKTYRWNQDVLAKEQQTEANDPLLNKRIHKAIDTTLAQRGFTLSNNQATDFIVSYQTEVQSRTTSEGTTGALSIGFGSFHHFGSLGLATGGDIREQDEATLMIDIIDAASSKLIWRGVSTRYVYKHNEPDELTRTINNHVEAILMQFPPSSSK